MTQSNQKNFDKVAILECLQSRIDYYFSNPELLCQVLVHPSLVGNSKLTKKVFGKKIEKQHTYDRLEFLGDRVLSLAIADWLYRTYPNEVVGKLAKRHTTLVKNETLSQISQNLALGEFVQTLTGQGMTPAGCLNKALNADVCEALLGAIYLDRGFEAASVFIMKAWEPYFLQWKQVVSDAKSKLQEWLQEQHLPLPQYKLLRREGPDHNLTFVIRLIVKDMAPVEAKASTKKEAEQEAARLLIKKLEIEDE